MENSKLSLWTFIIKKNCNKNSLIKQIIQMNIGRLVDLINKET